MPTTKPNDVPELGAGVGKLRRDTHQILLIVAAEKQHVSRSLAGCSPPRDVVLKLTEGGLIETPRLKPLQRSWRWPHTSSPPRPDLDPPMTPTSGKNLLMSAASRL